MSISLLKQYPNIIEKINSYLEPMFINNNMKLSIVNSAYYNEKLNYLINNSVPLKYAIDYARYPDITLGYIIELSKVMSIDDAYDILMNVPSREYKINNINIDEPLEEHIIIVNNLSKLLHYNYIWSILFVKYNISSNIIKILLHKLVDFYFFELLYYNKTINNYDVSLNMVIKSMSETDEYKNAYYNLRMAKVPQTIAYKLCKTGIININKIIEIANIGFYNVYSLEVAIHFNEIQINFLKLSKFGYVTYEEFNKDKQHIFNNAITQILINIDNHCNEPLAKKRK